MDKFGVYLFLHHLKIKFNDLSIKIRNHINEISKIKANEIAFSKEKDKLSIKLTNSIQGIEEKIKAINIDNTEESNKTDKTYLLQIKSKLTGYIAIINNASNSNDLDKLFGEISQIIDSIEK